jgi:hypothetical protein
MQVMAQRTTNASVSAVDLSFMRLEKFSYDGQTAKYTILIPADEGNRSVSFNDKRRPHPDLLVKFNALAPHLAELSEVSMGPENPVTVTELHVSRDKARIGFKVLGNRAYARSNGTMDLKPPMKWDEHSDDKQVLQKTTVDACHDLVDEIELFIKGKKLAQQDMFNNEPQTEEAPM